MKRLDAWRLRCVAELRSAVLSSAKVEEVIKWGHLVYVANGPVLLIRAEAERILFGFWRGQRLRETEPRLKPGGNYEMATLELREGDRLTAACARRLVKHAVALNQRCGDPTLVAKSVRDKRVQRPRTVRTISR